MSLRVAVVGAGLAGPCLVQGLARAGVDATLYERDAGVSARGQGYRLHLAAEGVAALRSCLPPDLFGLVLATAGRRGSGVTVLSGKLRVVRRVELPAPSGEQDGAAGLSADRQTLRRILLAGIEERTRFGATFERYEVPPAGGVRLRFAGGGEAGADVLVAADGAGSRIRAQLLPDAVVTPTGQLLIFGRTLLDAGTRRLAPAAALDGFATVAGSRGRFLPLAAHRFRRDPAAAAAAAGRPGLAFEDRGDYLMWVLGAPAAAFPAGLADRDGAALRDLAAHLIADWHPDVVELVRRGSPATVGTTVVRSAEPVPPWPTGPVTVMGDAIHCMVPAGIGAAAALRDAGRLATALSDVSAGRRELIPALREYEAEMLDHGFAAVARAREGVGAAPARRWAGGLLRRWRRPRGGDSRRR